MLVSPSHKATPCSCAQLRRGFQNKRERSHLRGGGLREARVERPVEREKRGETEQREQCGGQVHYSSTLVYVRDWWYSVSCTLKAHYRTSSRKVAQQRGRRQREREGESHRTGCGRRARQRDEMSIAPVSQFFILSPRGDTIISKDYRGDAVAGTTDIFFRKASGAYLLQYNCRRRDQWGFGTTAVAPRVRMYLYDMYV